MRCGCNNLGFLSLSSLGASLSDGVLGQMSHSVQTIGKRTVNQLVDRTEKALAEGVQRGADRLVDNYAAELVRVQRRAGVGPEPEQSENPAGPPLVQNAPEPQAPVGPPLAPQPKQSSNNNKTVLIVGGVAVGIGLVAWLASRK